MIGHESPWGWMLVGLVVGLFGAELLVISTSNAVTAGGVAAAAVGGTILFVSGVAAGVANGVQRADYLRENRRR